MSLPQPVNHPASASSKNFLLSNLSNQLVEFVTNSSISVRIFCVCILFGYALSFKAAAFQFLACEPGKITHVWSLFTHSFIEISLLQLVADWFIIFLYSKMIEPLWGVYECIKFYFIITVIVAVSTSFFYFTLFALTFDEYFLFKIKINGLGGFLGGFIVAIKQIMPDTVILNSSFLRLKQDHLPMLLILFSTLLYVIGLINLTYVIMLINGNFVGWVYLRFYQKHKNGTQGDSSSTFVFASFFPSQIQPFIAILANTIFNLLVKIKLCKKPPIRYNVAPGSQSQMTINLPLVNAGIENSDAERRRQKALKALKERLKKPDDEDVTNQWADRNSEEAVLLSVEKVETPETNVKNEISTTIEQNSKLESES